MKYLIIFLAAITFANAQLRYEIDCNKDLIEISLDSALSQTNTFEKTDRNDGEVKKYQKSAGLPKGAPYCAAGIWWSFAVAAEALGLNEDQICIPRTGLANNYFEFARKNGRRTAFLAQKHDLIVWRRGKTIFGHVERILMVISAGWVRTIAFNASNSRKRQGVFIKKRNIFHPLGRLRVRGLVGFKAREEK